MEFQERTIKVRIDHEKCRTCKTHACVPACKLYARGIISIQEGVPVLNGDADYAMRMGTDCLACEYECWFRGNSAITIEAPIPGLDEYRKKHGLD
ncbi:MAG: hypothetical protein RBT20_15060 [Syntrophales bacterium]|jgi:dissimilatory sulfite reductase (desulfoviridin) alpha/beta subunit|nr:hypothetical protein [Syntrophales bacterium]